MRRNKRWRLFAAGAGCLAISLLPACSVNVQKEANGEDKRVDIKSLLGGVHVSQQANVQDTGLAAYPGSHLKEKDSSGDDKSANVDISGFGYGIKVVALEYQSDDAPDKVLSFYKDQLKKYGKVLQCRTSSLHVDMNMKHDSGGNSKDLACEGDSGKDIELKVGRSDDQHIVAVEPEGKGSSFSLVYVRTHGKGADI